MAVEKKQPGKRSLEYQRRKARELAAKAAEEATDSLESKEALIKAQLSLLEQRTKGRPTDADADIDFAYGKMALDDTMPLDAPSLAAWEWYRYARIWPDKFLEICAKREDAKAKQAGTITNQRMEDDRRQQFAVIERIEKQLTLDVKSIIKDLMDKFPQDVLTECRKYDAAWKEFLARETS